MSDEMKRKRLRYLQLKAKAAAAAPVEPMPAEEPAAEMAAPAQELPPPAVAQGPSKSGAFARGAGQGVTFGFGDEVNGFIQALGEKYLPESLGGGGEQAQAKSLFDLYRGSRDSFRRENDAAERAHGGAYLGGNLAGGLATAALGSARALQLAGLGRFAPAAGAGTRTLGQMVREGVSIGTPMGTIAAAGSSDADLTRGNLDGLMSDARTGYATGLGFGAATPPVAAGVGWLGRNVLAPAVRLARGGYVTPTPEAQRLAKEGVELTVGQMNPESTFGRIEELTAGRVGVGGSVAAARERSADSARDVLLKLAGAPGMKPPTKGAPVPQQLEELRAGFTQLYDDALDGVRLNPGDERARVRAFTAAADSVVDASPDARASAIKWLTNQAKTLEPDAAGTVEARSVQALRTQIRDRIRSLGREGQDRQMREMLEQAEEVVSGFLTSRLPPERAGMLNAADATYRNLLSVEDAANRAFQQPDQKFTALQMLAAIRKKDSTPGLEAAARDVQKVLGARVPPTGMQVAATEALPAIRIAGPAWAAMVNASPMLRQHALRPLPPPGALVRGLGRFGREVGDVATLPAAGPSGARSLMDLLRPRPVTPFADDPEERNW